jgi:hypothetical protein
MPSALVEKKASNRRSSTSGARPLAGVGDLNSTTPGLLDAWAEPRAAPRCAARAALASVDGLGRVLQQVDQHLLDQDRVDISWAGARHVVGQAHVAAAQLDLGQLHASSTMPARRPVCGWVRCASRSADALDDLARALGLARGLFQRASRSSSVICRLDARDHAAAVVVDGGQRLVQFVRHAGGHLAHGDQAAGPTGRARPAGGLLLGQAAGVMSVAITICARRPSTQFR